MSLKIQYQYFQIKSSREDYLGVRFFKYSPHELYVTQILFSNGDTKKGKSNTMGIYLIGKMTFCSNYLSMNYVESITKSKYDESFEKMIQMLK